MPTRTDSAPVSGRFALPDGRGPQSQNAMPACGPLAVADFDSFFGKLPRQCRNIFCARKDTQKRMRFRRNFDRSGPVRRVRKPVQLLLFFASQLTLLICLIERHRPPEDPPDVTQTALNQPLTAHYRLTLDCRGLNNALNKFVTCATFELRRNKHSADQRFNVGVRLGMKFPEQGLP